MKVFICTDHDDHYPVGVASVVIAKTKKTAQKLLDAALVECGLRTFALKPYTLRVLSTDKASAHVLRDGNY